MLTAVSYREASPAPNGAPPTAEKIVQMYRDNGNKLGVPDMRKFMKTMVAEVFLQDKFSAIHKCRGIWKQKPSDWDPNVPFADPNNAENASQGNKKPSKKTLKDMMSYLVQKYEETNPVKKSIPSYKMQVQDEKKPLIPATQTTEGGNPCTQTSDWQELMQQLKSETEQEEFDGAPWAQEPIAVNPCDILENDLIYRTPWEESSGAEPQEESCIIDAAVDITDLVAYIDEPTSNQHQEEVGGSHANCNVQMQNTNTEMIHQVPAAQLVDYPPVVAAHQAPPPSREMEGVPVSNAGVLGITGGTVFAEGEKTDDTENLATFNGQNTLGDDLFPDLGNIILAQNSDGLLDDLFQDVGNFTIVQNSNGFAWTDIQMMNQVEQTQHPTMEESTYNQPMVETECSQVIPTVVEDFDMDTD